MHIIIVIDPHAMNEVENMPPICTSLKLLTNCHV